MLRFACCFAITMICSLQSLSFCIAGEDDFPIKVHPSTLTHKLIQKELKLTPDQIKKVNEFQNAYKGHSSKEYSQDIQEKLDKAKLQSDRQLESRLRLEGMKQVRDKVDAQLRPRMAEILSAEQLKRFREISVQQRGLDDLGVRKALKFTDDQEAKAATLIKEMKDERSKRERDPNYWREDRDRASFSFPSGRVLEALKLTPEQQKVLKELQDEAAKQPSPIQQTLQRIKTFHKELDAKVLALMTDEQKKEYDVLKGKEFDVDRLSPFSNPAGIEMPKPAAEKAEE